MSVLHNCELRLGNCLDLLQAIPNESIQLCVTSPPYYGLRDYGNKHQIGLEETPRAYVEKLTEVFSEVRRVLKSDGLLYLNLGDCYANPRARTQDTSAGFNQRYFGQGEKETKQNSVNESFEFKADYGIAPKNLLGIPWRVAFALQDDGWILRQDIIWAKKNPMPESIKDRCTKSHEYLFMFAKNPQYYYDAEAIKESAQDCGLRKPIPSRDGAPESYQRMNLNLDKNYASQGRNKRSVWSLASQPYKDAHFATFPPDLIRPCILAGSRVHDLVLDPFSGAATTGLVCIEENRRYLGLELNAEYLEISRKRLAKAEQQPNLFFMAQA